MTSTHNDSSVSRRAALAGAGILSLTFAARGLIASAQDDSPEATPYPMAGHPIIGVWQMDIELRQPGVDLATFIFREDATFVAVSVQYGWIAFGSWRATGARSAEVFYVLEEVPTQDAFAPDFVPAANVFTPSEGILALRISFDVDPTGTTLAGSGSGTFYGSDGEIQNEFSGDDARMAGTRMELVASAAPATPTS